MTGESTPAGRVVVDLLIGDPTRCQVDQLALTLEDAGLNLPAMPVIGCLKNTSFEDVLQNLCDEQATGVLRLIWARGVRDVVFAEGVIVDLVRHGSSRTQAVIERLEAKGLIGQEDHEQQDDFSGTFSTLKGLVLQGRLQQSDLDQTVSEHVLEELCDLFLWSDANYRFRTITSGDSSAFRVVERGRLQAVTIPVGDLLTASFERLAAWDAVANDLPRDHQVLAMTAGAGAPLAKEYELYPRRPILNAVNGVRTLDEIFELVSVARTQAGPVIYDALCEGVFRVLSTDELEDQAARACEQGAEATALRLFSTVLALEPERAMAVTMLAKIIDSADALDADKSQGYQRLAISYLALGQQELAVEAAEAATKYQASVEAGQVLVRCLFESGFQTEMSQALIALTHAFIVAGRLDDARGAIQQVLEIDPDNDQVARAMALIHQAAADEGRTIDLDTIDCIICGEANPRSQTSCQSCQSALVTTCLNCGRQAAASDQVCLICGSNPHVNHAEAQHAGPTTTAIFTAANHHPQSDDPSAQSQMTVTANQLQRMIRDARDLESQEEYYQALDAWRVIAKQCPSSQGVKQHVRILQQIVHDLTIADFIDQANAFRRGRRLIRAQRRYRQAFRAIAVDDKRRPHLQKLIRATRRQLLVSNGIYVAAIGLIASAAWLFAWPEFQLHQLRQDVKVFERQLDTALAQITPATYGGVESSWQALEQRGQRLGESGQAVLASSQTLVNGARLRAAEHALGVIQKAIDQQDYATAESEIAHYQTLFADLMGDRIDGLRQIVQTEQAALAAAPAAWQHVEQLLADQQLLEVIQMATPLTTAGDQDIARRAQDLVQQLNDQQAAHHEAVYNAVQLSATNWPQAIQMLEDIAPEAAYWGTQQPIQQQLTDLRAFEIQAEAEFVRAFHSISMLQEFIEQYQPSSQFSAALSQIDRLQRASQVRADERDAWHQRWISCRDGEDWALAYRHAQRLWSAESDFARAQGVTFPFVLDSGQSDAQLVLADEIVATADADGRLVWWYQEWPRQPLQLVADNYESITVERSSRDPWQQTLHLQRAAEWSLQAGGPISHLTTDASDGDLFMVTGAQFQRRSYRESQHTWQLSLERVRHGLMSDRGEQLADIFMLNGSDMASASSYVVGDGYVGSPIACIANQEHLTMVAERDEQGGHIEQLQIPTAGPVLAAPAWFFNELRGVEPRLAFIDPYLRVGSLDELSESSQPAQSVAQLKEQLAGPIIRYHDLDCVLAVVGVDGWLRLVDDTTYTVRSQLDLTATHVSYLTAVSPHHLIAVLDGSRIAVVNNPEVASLSLDREIYLPNPIQFAPQVIHDEVFVPMAGQLQWYHMYTGQLRATAPLPGSAIVAPVLIGHRQVAVAVAMAADELDTSGTVEQSHHYMFGIIDDQGEVVWLRRTEIKPTALTVTEAQVLVGFADGSIQAYSL